MQKWAFNILINASKHNARRRERLFKYCIDIHIENGVIRFDSTSRVFDIEAQAYTDNGRILYEDNETLDYDYEPIDWYM
jgi:hypothetical protein